MGETKSRWRRNMQCRWRPECFFYRIPQCGDDDEAEADDDDDDDDDDEYGVVGEGSEGGSAILPGGFAAINQREA